MSKLKPGLRVAVLIDNKLIRGTIQSVYDDFDQAVVKIDDGDVIKVCVSYICIEEENERNAQEEPSEPVEKSEITITPAEFKKIAMEVAKREAGGSPMTRIAFTIFSAELHKALFLNEGDNA